MLKQKTFIQKIILGAICLLVLPSILIAKDRITWMKYVWPPVYINEGPYKGRGNADAILQFFQEELTEYVHQTQTVNSARALQSMKNGKKVCIVGTLKTPEREKFLLYAIPIGITLPNAIIVKQSKLSLFGNVDTLSLEQLLKNNKMKGGIIHQRSYTPVIDSILEKYKNQSNLYVKSSANMVENIFNMLMLDRLDYIIERLLF